MSEEKDLNLDFKGIKEISFNNKFNDNILRDFNEDNILLAVGFSITGNKDNNIVSIIIDIKYRYPVLNSKPIEFFSFSTESFFQFYDLENNQSKLEIKDDSVFVEDDLMIFLLSISIGATRGMISYKLSSLPVDIVLPIIDVTTLMDAYKQAHIKNDKKNKASK
ncbi:hypothetical protein D3C87_592690 [compost metagenome]